MRPCSFHFARRILQALATIEIYLHLLYNDNQLLIINLNLRTKFHIFYLKVKNLKHGKNSDKYLFFSKKTPNILLQKTLKQFKIQMVN